MIGESSTIQPENSGASKRVERASEKADENLANSRDAFFSRETPFGSSTNLERYRGNLASISEAQLRETEPGDGEVVGLRARRFASVDDSISLSFGSLERETTSEGSEGFWSWLWRRDEEDNSDAKDNAVRSKSEGSATSAASLRLMRQITMENVLEGVYNTPLSPKLSLSVYRTDTDTFSPKTSNNFSEIAESALKSELKPIKEQEDDGNFISSFFMTSGKSSSPPERSKKKPDQLKADKRTVTFRSKDSYDEDELSYLVETLSRSESRESSSRRRSLNFSVSGTMGLDEIPTPREMTPKRGVWPWIKSIVSPSARTKKDGFNANIAAVAPVGTPTRSAAGVAGGSPTPASLTSPEIRDSVGSSRNGADVPGTYTRTLSTTDFTNNSPPRSSLLLESEREARTMVTMLFGFSDSERVRRRALSRSRKSVSGGDLREGHSEKMLTSGSGLKGVAEADLSTDKEIELKALSPPGRMTYSSRGGASPGGPDSPYRAWSLRSSGSDSVASHSGAASKHSSHDSLYNLFFHPPGSSAGHSDNTSDWGPALSARSSFASHWTEGSADSANINRSQRVRGRTRSGSSASSGSASHVSGDAPVSLILRAAENGIRRTSSTLLSLGRNTLRGGSGDSAFQEYIRIQPFAAGGYMRGMLVCGFCTLFFHMYTLTLWPDLSLAPTTPHGGTFGVFLSAAFGVKPSQYVATVEAFLYAWFVLLTVLNILQLPSRIVLHLWSWKCSRAVEVESALVLVRAMVNSDVWLLNRMLGRVMDLSSLLSLLIGEVYLWTSTPDDPLRSLVVSLCSTCLLAFIVRVGIATTFAVSMHDPSVLAEARRRGLSKWDFTKLPSFVFTDFKEVTNKDCSICLGTFDLGEMVTQLPCDQKHSFHSPCIRTWLERQNSCPLCMKMV